MTGSPAEPPAVASPLPTRCSCTTAWVPISTAVARAGDAAANTKSAHAGKAVRRLRAKLVRLRIAACGAALMVIDMQLSPLRPRMGWETNCPFPSLVVKHPRTGVGGQERCRLASPRAAALQDLDGGTCGFLFGSAVKARKTRRISGR